MNIPQNHFGACEHIYRKPRYLSSEAVRESNTVYETLRRKIAESLRRYQLVVISGLAKVGKTSCAMSAAETIGLQGFSIDCNLHVFRKDTSSQWDFGHGEPELQKICETFSREQIPGKCIILDEASPDISIDPNTYFDSLKQLALKYPDIKFIVIIHRSDRLNLSYLKSIFEETQHHVITPPEPEELRWLIQHNLGAETSERIIREILLTTGTHPMVINAFTHEFKQLIQWYPADTDIAQLARQTAEALIDHGTPGLSFEHWYYNLITEEERDFIRNLANGITEQGIPDTVDELEELGLIVRTDRRYCINGWMFEEWIRSQEF